LTVFPTKVPAKGRHQSSQTALHIPMLSPIDLRDDVRYPAPSYSKRRADLPRRQPGQLSREIDRCDFSCTTPMAA
jgi:hypothetical protein